MRIGLIDADKTSFPNLALMKISAYHKAKGDEVEWVGVGWYNRIYVSKVFTFTPDIPLPMVKFGEIIKGGTGYNLDVLPDEIENMQPDYSIYGITDTAYGFITRGCNRKCPWCVVPKKEGRIKFVKDIEDIVGDKKRAILLDNNILASKEGIEQLEKIARMKIRVDFNQGLDARLVTPEIADILARIKWIESIRFAVDSKAQIKPVLRAMQLLIDRGVAKSRFNNYLLLNNDIEDCYYRAKVMRDFGVKIAPQPYRDFTGKNKIPQWQKDFARWGNRKAIYKSVDFKEYRPRKGFVCSEYFEKKEKWVWNGKTLSL